MEIAAGDYRLVVAPDRGGAILRFDWRGQPVLRPAEGPSILDAACFPLVPFSNRIAQGRFAVDGREVRLRPNFPGSDQPHPLHGFGWLAPWQVVVRGECHLVMAQAHPAGEWPWAYRAEQHLALDEGGLALRLAVTNQSADPMPLGLGFHPYFPCDAQTRYRGLHRGEWHNDAEGIPLSLDERAEPQDWWYGAPVATRSVDTVYTGRAGPLEIAWPTRGMRATLTCSDRLAHTVVYSPPGADFFCVEPVTNQTDAFNRGACDALAPGATREVRLRITSSAL